MFLRLSMKTNLDHNCVTCNTRINSVFSVLNAEQTEELNKNKLCNVYKKGQLIFSENGIPLGLFCIHSGKIKLSKLGLDGKEQILRLNKAGDILGYRALLSNDRYHCTATALEDCSICVIDKSFFTQLVFENQRICFEVFKKISDDLKTAEEHLLSLSQKNVRERVAEALLFFKATYGFELDNLTLNIQFSREEIAGFVGTSTESIIRQLSELNTDKIIELDSKKIKIIDLPKLTKIANVPY